MPAPIVKVDGLPRLRRALREAGESMADLKQANAATAALVASTAAARAPRRSGRLAASVRGNRAAGKASVLAGGAAVPYAGPIHWGWPARGIAAQPFASEAATSTESSWLPLYAAELQRIADKAGGRY
jgi:hypothetical protein